jgi:hypothetical protein
MRRITRLASRAVDAAQRVHANLQPGCSGEVGEAFELLVAFGDGVQRVIARAAEALKASGGGHGQGRSSQRSRVAPARNESSAVRAMWRRWRERMRVT